MTRQQRNNLILAGQLEDLRDSMKTLLGPRYTEDVNVARQVLRGYATAHKLGLAEAALAIGKEMDAAHQSPDLIFAAFVDEVEAKS